MNSNTTFAIMVVIFIIAAFVASFWFFGIPTTMYLSVLAVTIPLSIVFLFGVAETVYEWYKARRAMPA